MLYLDPDWNPKKALNLRNHFEPIVKNNPVIFCDTCKKRHFPDENTFIVFYGNVTVGFTGGIIGNNFSEDGKLKRVHVVCRNIQCMKPIISLLEQPPTHRNNKDMLDH